jgi:DNA processing protein
VPGEITSALSAGTNGLLKLGASPLTCAADLLSCFGIEQLEAAELEVSGETARVLALLREAAAGADELARASGLPASTVARALVELELGGRVIGADGLYRPISH